MAIHPLCDCVTMNVLGVVQDGCYATWDGRIAIRPYKRWMILDLLCNEITKFVAVRLGLRQRIYWFGRYLFFEHF